MASGADRPWFKLVLETRTTAIGEYQISRLSGEPNINVAHPLLDRDGHVKRVLVAALELRTMGALLDRLEIPAGATVALFDRNRTILARHPDSAVWVGKQVPSTALLQAADVNPPGMIEETGVDGVRRLDSRRAGGRRCADRSVRQDGRRPLGGVRASQPGAEPFAVAARDNRDRGDHHGGGERRVLRPPAGQGADCGDRPSRERDLASRAQLAGGPRELGELGDAFNSMAAALQTRQLERDHAEQQLRDSEERYRMPFEAARSVVGLRRRDAAFMEVNAPPAITTATPAKSSCRCGSRTSARRGCPGDARARMQGARRTGLARRRRRGRHRKKDGTLIDGRDHAEAHHDRRPAGRARARPRRHRAPAARAAARRGAEDGGDRPARGRRRARLQQPADGRSWATPRSARATRARATSRARSRRSARGRRRRAALTRQLLAFSRRQVLQPARPRPQRDRRRHRTAMLRRLHRRRHRARHPAGPATCAGRRPIPVSSSRCSSTSPSTPATRCPTAAC